MNLCTNIQTKEIFQNGKLLKLSLKILKLYLKNSNMQKYKIIQN